MFIFFHWQFSLTFQHVHPCPVWKIITTTINPLSATKYFSPVPMILSLHNQTFSKHFLVMHADPLKSLRISFKVPLFTLIYLLNLSPDSFLWRENRRECELLNDADTVHEQGRPLCLCLAEWFSSLSWLLLPPSTSFLPLYLVSLGFHSLLVFQIFFETFFQHWSIFCSLCSYQFIPLLWGLRRA